MVQQKSPFDKKDTIEGEGLSYAEIADVLNVSYASINNWVKAGYLEKHYNPKYVTKKSFDIFNNSIVGTEKLNSRANKQHAELHKHDELSFDILQKVWKNLENKNHGDQLAQIYEDALSSSHKNIEGVYYTPVSICQDLFSKLDLDNTSLFCDPCCGSGNFLVSALEAGVRPENITGYDTDSLAIEIAKRRIFDRTGYKSDSLFVSDFLSLSHYEKYDVIITNPPWGKKYSKQEKQAYSKKVGLQQSLDTCSLFTLAILKSVNSSGKVGLLLPESFFNIKSFHEIRKLVLAQQVDWLIDYGKPFDGLMTRAYSIVFSKKMNSLYHQVGCLTDNVTTKYKQTVFSQKPFAIINFTVEELEMEVIDSMLHRHHTTLKNKAQWGIGIVTGNNKKHLRRSPQKGFVPILKGSDIQKGEIKESTHYIKDDFSRYQQVAPLALYTAPCKIIYKFISSKIVFFCDNEQHLLLNSANMMVVEEDNFVTMTKLTAYLNLDIINWFHQKLFNTHKILRSNLEYVPIYLDYLNNIEHPSNQMLMNYLDIEKINGTYRLKK